MIDIENSKIIDMIDSRDGDVVTKWLKTYPNLEIISRDGSIVYKKSITAAHPNATQISDRFHLLKNLTEYAKSYIKRKFESKVILKEINKIDLKTLNFLKEKYAYETKWDLIMRVKELRNENFNIKDICKILGIGNRSVIKYSKISESEKNKYNNTTKKKAKSMAVANSKQEIIDKVKELHTLGMSQRKIAKEMSLSRQTISRYIKLKNPWRHGSYGVNKGSILDSFKTKIHSLLANGYKAKDIYEELKKEGYLGGYGLVRTYIASFKNSIIENRDSLNYEYVNRKLLINLIFKPIDKIKEITVENYKLLVARYSDYKIILDIVKEFKDVLFERKKNLIDWIKKYKALDINEINSFIGGIERDIEAVKNAICFKYSNGLAEGKINKLKVIKRIMYGRCDFSTLRSKILLIESD